MSFPRYPEYRDSGVEWLGEVPGHWGTCALKRVVAMQSGESITGEAIEESGDYPVFGGNGLRGYTSAFTHDGHFALIGRQGALCGNINYATGRFWASEHAVVATPIKPISTIWLGELLRAMNLNQYSVAAAQPGLSVDLVGRIGICLPPLPEQTQIAAFLDRETAKIDALVAEQEKLIALLKEKRQAVISHAVTKGLDPSVAMKDSGVEWLGEVPAHWEVMKMKWIAEMQSGHTPDKKVAAYWDDGDIPWVSLNDTGYLKDNDYISETAYSINQLGIENSSARLLPPRVVVFSRDATIGRCAITTRPMAVSQHFIAWVCGASMIPEFLLLRLRSMTHELDRLTTGATLKTIGMPDVRTIVTPVPPLREQEGIIDWVSDQINRIDGLVAQALRAVDLLQERRTALISAAVTGKIDVRGLEVLEAA
jgi:type I restriction enzyme S subunit